MEWSIRLKKPAQNSTESDRKIQDHKTNSTLQTQVIEIEFWQPQKLLRTVMTQDNRQSLLTTVQRGLFEVAKSVKANLNIVFSYE